jgi:hypothetical protein
MVIRTIAFCAFVGVQVLLAFLGFPLAIVIAPLVWRRVFSCQPRPRPNWLNDALGAFFRLSAICGAVVAALVVAGVLLDRWVASGG